LGVTPSCWLGDLSLIPHGSHEAWKPLDQPLGISSLPLNLSIWIPNNQIMLKYLCFFYNGVWIKKLLNAQNFINDGTLNISLFGCYFCRKFKMMEIVNFDV
jgi:hypothetical protein